MIFLHFIILHRIKFWINFTEGYHWSIELQNTIKFINKFIVYFVGIFILHRPSFLIKKLLMYKLVAHTNDNKNNTKLDKILENK